MRVLLIALLAAISYAQTELDRKELGDSIGVERDGVDCYVYKYGDVGDYGCPTDSRALGTSDASSCVQILPNYVTFFIHGRVRANYVCDFVADTQTGGMKEFLEYEGPGCHFQIYTIICPTDASTQNPTLAPSTNPTSAPSKNPTSEPSANPTLAPSAHPTSEPSKNPTSEPSANPTLAPSAPPTLQPTTTTTTTTSGEQEESCKYPVDVCRLIKIFDDERNDARCPDGCTGCFINGNCELEYGGCTVDGGKDCTNTVTWVERPREADPEVAIELYQRRSRAERFDGACKRINSVVKDNFKHTERDGDRDECTVSNEETKKKWRQMQKLCWDGHEDKMDENGQPIRVPKTESDLTQYWVRVQRRLRGCREEEGAGENCREPAGKCLLDLYDTYEEQCNKNN